MSPISGPSRRSSLQETPTSVRGLRSPARPSLGFPSYSVIITTVTATRFSMAPQFRLFVLAAALVLLLANPPVFTGAGALSTLESVPDLQKAMYRNIESYPCVRLLNLSGEIGCSNPGREKIIAPIVSLKNATAELDQYSTVLLPLEAMNDFFRRVSKDSSFAQKVAGVLIEPAVKSVGFSPVEKFPQYEFAPYAKSSYEWNPTGSGVMFNRYNFPVFLLSNETYSILQEKASENAKNNYQHPLNVAEFDLIMQTTRAGSHDSQSCLKQQTCLPLGGFSVWSSLPPINISSAKPPKPIVLAVASQDSASFFRDRSLGADSPISGLIALLTAVDALSRVRDLEKLKKQLVFTVFTGEAWGYLGSRKFLQELDDRTNSVYGLNDTMIDGIVEVGSVGKSINQDATTFYAHADGDLSVTKEMLKAFQTASDSLGSDNVKIKSASASNPGLPPSSLMAFRRKNSSTSGIVIEDFDSSFSNKFYHSHLDDPSNIDSSSIAAAAALIARALYVLADDDLNLMSLNSIRVNVSLVKELVGCLLTCGPGLSCDIVKGFISPSNDCPSHYVGVYLDNPSGTQEPQYADDTSRFVWNFLADRTSIPMDNTKTCNGECSNIGEVCIGPEVSGKGRCAISTTRYIPAYSTRLRFEDYWRVVPTNSSDPVGSADPVWTESYWNTIGVQVYKVQSAAYDRLILVGGLGVTIASYVAIIVVKSFISKAVKRD